MVVVFEGKTVNDVWGQAFEALSEQAKAGYEAGSRDGAIVDVLRLTIFLHSRIVD